MHIIRELECHYPGKLSDTRESRGLGELSVRGYGTNLNLISGVTKENPEQEKPEKQTLDDEGSTAVFSSLIKTN